MKNILCRENGPRNNSPEKRKCAFGAITTRTSPAGAWGAEGFNAEGITLGNQSRSFLPIACFCGYFRCFELVSIISLGISRFSIVFSVFSHGFLWVPMHQSRSFVPIPLFQWYFSQFSAIFRSFFWVFCGFSSCFGVIQCVLDVFCGFPMYFDHACCHQSPRLRAAAARSQETSPILSPTHPDLVH